MAFLDAKRFRYFLVCLVLLFVFGGSIAYEYIPFHDDLTVLGWPWLLHGFRYWDNDSWLFFRPIEYFVYCLSKIIGLSSLPIIINYAILAFTAVFAVDSICCSSGPLKRFEYLAIPAFLVLHPIISASAFQVDTLSQCLANFSGVYLLRTLILEKFPRSMITFVVVLGLLAKESFVPVLVLYLVVIISKKNHYRLAIYIVSLLAIWMLTRNLIVSPRELESTPARYLLSLGPNFISNIGLHIAGLFYLGSSPDLFARAYFKEFPAIISSLFLSASSAWAAFHVHWNPKLLMMALFAAVATFPHVFFETVSEHNASAFVWFGLIFAVSLIRNAFEPNYVIILFVICASLSAHSTVRKSSLLHATMKDFEKMKVQYELTGQVSCERRYETSFSYYFFNSEKHLPFLDLGGRSGRVTGDESGYLSPSC